MDHTELSAEWPDWTSPIRTANYNDGEHSVVGLENDNAFLESFYEKVQPAPADETNVLGSGLKRDTIREVISKLDNRYVHLDRLRSWMWGSQKNTVVQLSGIGGLGKSKLVSPVQKATYMVLKDYFMPNPDIRKLSSDHVIPGLLDSQHPVDATGDTGAKYNFLNEDYAKRCKFKIDPTARTLITIASGQKVMTTGISEVSFSFRGEQTPYPLKFHILPGCIKNVILGKSFLKATKTFSNALHFAKRVVKRFTRTLNTHQVMFLGASPPMFAGLLNGETKTALADSASKVLIMDEDYARTLGLSIVSTKKTCIKLRFADGSTAFTSGKTYNVSWQFGAGKRYPLDFYILKNAPADVILSEDFLLRETKAFIEYADCLIEEDENDDIGYYDDSDDDDYFFAIDRDENYHPKTYTEGADQYFEDDREDARRTEEDLHINSLTGDEKEAAIARAKERRKQWAEKQAANSLAQGSQPSTTNTASPSAAPQLHTSNAIGVPSTSKHQRWRFKLMRKRKSGQTGQNP
ncbi:hypothetical protein yc1106_00351 [Curvularia clavata]|uniref:Uncharacterized protein n=1 Tax=Curvularia clavata TaxID=95742 RepID=A0A9Q8YZH6_CURCL|nr:hypothetical protein yc1106_00351 [Curvularia clavata]